MQDYKGLATHLVIAAIGALVLGGAVSAQTAGKHPETPRQDRQAQVPQAGQQRTDTRSVQIAVAPASAIIGKSVRDNSGVLIGEVEHLLIDAGTGKVEFAVLGPRGILAPKLRLDEMTAVPWNEMAAEFYNSGDIRTLSLDVAAADVEAAPRLERDEIGRIGKPTLKGRFVEHYLPVQPDRRSGEAAGKSAGASGKAARGDARETPEAYVLVGRTFITTLASPEYRLAEAIKGASVRDSGGAEVGQIDRLMIDVHGGQVAYVLLSTGGFLGMGETWRAVPLNALEWQGGEVFGLEKSSQELADMPTFTDERVPNRIRIRDLEELHQQYGVQLNRTQGRR